MLFVIVFVVMIEQWRRNKLLGCECARADLVPRLVPNNPASQTAGKRRHHYTSAKMVETISWIVDRVETTYRVMIDWLHFYGGVDRNMIS